MRDELCPNCLHPLKKHEKPGQLYGHYKDAMRMVKNPRTFVIKKPYCTEPLCDCISSESKA